MRAFVGIAANSNSWQSLYLKNDHAYRIFDMQSCHTIAANHDTLLSGLIAGGGFNLSAHDPIQQQHNFPLIPFQWHPEHPLCRGLCSHLLCCLPSGGHSYWAPGEEDWKVQHSDHDFDSLDCCWDYPVSCVWGQSSV